MPLLRSLVWLYVLCWEEQLSQCSQTVLFPRTPWALAQCSSIPSVVLFGVVLVPPWALLPGFSGHLLQKFRLGTKSVGRLATFHGKFGLWVLLPLVGNVPILLGMVRLRCEVVVGLLGGILLLLLLWGRVRATVRFHVLLLRAWRALVG